MARKMMQFTDIARRTPDKRSVEARKTDFREIYDRFAKDRAGEQSSRCEQCGVPFCQIHCPLGNNIPDWLMLTARGRLREAYEAAAATNPMPEICGRICPQDRLCEGSCVLEQAGHGTVTIGAVEKYITDAAWENGWVEPIRPMAARGESVGVIGAGPAGLAAAEHLRLQGFQTHLYDRYERMGGLLVYGIPAFKLDKDVVERRIGRLSDAGVIFHPNTDVGVTVPFSALRDKHDALLIATGVYKARALSVPGSGFNGVAKALDYLIASNRAGLGDAPSRPRAALNARGKAVVVIGGGDTAMDCVRTAVRQGAKSVVCLYRRDRANMPGSRREVANAEEEGVTFQWLAAPEALLNEGADAAVSGVRAMRMRLGDPDASGRQAPRAIPGSQHVMPADLVIEALGFDPQDLPGMFAQDDLRTTRWGALSVDAAGMTALDGVFAAGDIVRGASLVVWAIRDGRAAAAAIADYLLAKRPPENAQALAAQ